MKALKRLKNFAGKKQKKESRKASIVISATLILHAQLCFPLVTKAQTSPIAPTTESIPASEHGSPLPPPQAPGASNVLTPEITSLLVPSANQTQTIFDVATTNGVLHFTDFINTDSLHIVSTNAQYSTATIFATGNIINAGTITTLIPTGFTGAISNLNLVLNAGGSIFNSGTISSAGSLNLTAGNAIVNVVTPQLPQSIPVMQAQTDIVMQATSIINQGTINSAIGNVNLCSATSNLAINNIAGTITAPNGFINVFTSDMLHSATLDILGGDFVARALKLKSGLVSVDVNSISGPVNLTAVEAALIAHTGTLEFGTANVSGDPFIESGGDFIFKDGVTLADRLILNATGSILTDGTATAIATNHELVLNAGGVINLAGVTSLFSEGGDIKLTANGSIFVPGVSITSNGGNVFIHSENSNVSMPGAQIKSSGGDVGIVAQENVELADSKVQTVIDTSGTLAGRVFIASKQGSVLLDHPEGPASLIKAGPDQQAVVLGRYGVAIGAFNEIRVGNILAPNADVAVVSGVNTVLLAAETFGIDINGTRGLGSGGISIGSIDSTNAPEGSAFEGFSGTFVWSTNGGLRNNQGSAIKTPGTLAISAINDIELAGITDVSAERRVHIASFNGSTNLPDAAVSSKFLVSNLPPLQSTSVLPNSAQSVQILAHGAVTTGDIKSPAGGVHVRSAADLTGTANDNLKVSHGTSNIGNVSLGTVDISSSEFTGSGNIFIDAGENHISTGSIIGNGSTVFLGGAQTISITATDEEHPALSNNAAGSQGNLPFFKANTSIQAPGSIIITGTNNPLGDIRHDGGSLTIASLFDSLTLNNIAFINTNDTFNNAFTVILQGESGVSFNGGQPLTVNAHPNTENVAFVNDFTVRSFSGDLSFSGPVTINGSAQSNNAQGATVALLSGSLSTNGKISINADGQGTGSGGVINVVTGSAPTFGLGNLQLQARGGSNGSGGQIAVESATGLTVDARSLDVTAGTNGNGGLIRLDGADMFVPGTQLIVTGGALKADGNGTGNGGTVQLINGQSAFVLGGKGANATGINVRSGLEGGNGGTVLAQSGGDLTINTANVNTEARGENGSGGNIRLRAGISGGDFGFIREHNGALTINGAINVSGTGVGDGGTIVAEAYAAGPEGGGGGVGSLALTAAPGSIQVNDSLVARAGEVGRGGSISLQTVALKSAEAIPAAVIIGGLDNTEANLHAEGGTTSGDGGTINIDSNGSVELNSSVISANARSHGAGGTIHITMDAGPGGDDGGGGGVSLLNTVASNSPRVLHIEGILQSDSKTTGNGGNLTFSIEDKSVTVEFDQNVKLFARGGTSSGDGGKISFVNQTGASSSIEISDISVAARGKGNGGELSFQSKGSLSLVANSISADSVDFGNGGRIEVNASGEDSDLVIGSELNTVNLLARSGRHGGNGGDIVLLAGRSLSLPNGSIDVDARSEGAGGQIVIEGNRNGSAAVISLLGNLSAKHSGPAVGGKIAIRSFESLNGTLTQVLIDGKLSTDAREIGNGGSIKVSSDQEGSSIEFGSRKPSRITSFGGSENGSGGVIEIFSKGSVNLGTTAVLADAHSLSGNGGSISISALGALADIDFSKSGNVQNLSAGGNSGGRLKLEAGRNVEVNGKLVDKFRGSSLNGPTVEIASGLSSGGSITIKQGINASAATGTQGIGGNVLLTAKGNASLSKIFLHGQIDVQGGVDPLFGETGRIEIDAAEIVNSQGIYAGSSKVLIQNTDETGNLLVKGSGIIAADDVKFESFHDIKIRQQAIQGHITANSKVSGRINIAVDQGGLNLKEINTANGSIEITARDYLIVVGSVIANSGTIKMVASESDGQIRLERNASIIAGRLPGGLGGPQPNVTLEVGPTRFPTLDFGAPSGADIEEFNISKVNFSGKFGAAHIYIGATETDPNGQVTAISVSSTNITPNDALPVIRAEGAVINLNAPTGRIVFEGGSGVVAGIIRPVAFVNSIGPKRNNIETISILDGAAVLGPKTLDRNSGLPDGDYYLETSKDIEMRVSDELSLLSGREDVFLIAKHGEQTEITCLTDRSGKSKVSIKKHLLRISSGQRLILSKDVIQEGIAIRNQTLFEAHGYNCLLSEFSFPSLFKSSVMLRKAWRNAQFRNSMKRVAKTQSALFMITSNRGAFKEW